MDTSKTALGINTYLDRPCLGDYVTKGNTQDRFVTIPFLLKDEKALDVSVACFCLLVYNIASLAPNLLSF